MTAVVALGEGRSGAGRNGRGGEGVETTTVAKMNAAALETKTKELPDPGTARLYWCGPFSTGPWLEPVLKGL